MKTYHFKTLGVVEWDEIEVGEVFANNAADFEIVYKLSENSVIPLAEAHNYNFCRGIGRRAVTCFDIADRIPLSKGNFEHHKLPISVQRRWVERT